MNNLGRPGRLGRCPIEHDDYGSVMLRVALALIRWDYAHREAIYRDDPVMAMGDLSRWLSVNGLHSMVAHVGLVRHYVLNGCKLVDVYDEHKAIAGPRLPARRQRRGGGR